MDDKYNILQMQSDTIGKLALALAKAQKTIKFSNTDGDNTFISEKKAGAGRYSTLHDIWAACNESLSNNELAVVQTTDNVNSEIVVITTLVHSSGEYIRGRLAIKPAKYDAQGIGSAITYARRYTLAAICGVAPIDASDDDGETAVGRGSTAKSRPQQINVQSIIARIEKCKATPELSNVKAKYITPIWGQLNAAQQKTISDAGTLKSAEIIKKLKDSKPKDDPKKLKALRGETTAKMDELGMSKTVRDEICMGLSGDEGIVTPEQMDVAMLTDLNKLLDEKVTAANAAAKDDIPF